jgi:UDP-2,3-diacylglucosamine hydrolase
VTTSTPPRFAELQAPESWRTVDFISDLHLQAGDPLTFQAWRRYMGGTPADAVFILGDLFELWVGDDAAWDPGFTRDCGEVLRDASARRAVFFMHGNRDFLVGDDFLRGCGASWLADPTVLVFGGERWLLTHGDMLCLADVEYLRYRQQVRDPSFQREFLARPLAERQDIGRQMRERSEAKKAALREQADVDDAAALDWLHAAQAPAMIHGHTHRPADHALDGGHRRIVLSDWDERADPPRRQVLRLQGLTATRLAGP